MKNLLLTAITILTLGSQAFAFQEAYQAGGDQMNEIIKCQPNPLHSDMGMSVSVSTGGIAGLTQVTVERFFGSRSSSNTYIVKALRLHPGQLGEAVTYSGSNIRLTVNFTSGVGSAFGVLKIRDNGQVSSENLTCELIQQNPQVNYVY